jgi:hypothetical protein
MTAFRFTKRIQKSLLRVPKIKLSGDVEVDEMYLKAGLKGKNFSEKIKEIGRKARKRGLKRRGRGTYKEDKVPIFALCQRGGDFVVESGFTVSSHFVKRLVGKYVQNGSRIDTDDFSSYILPRYDHRTICHSRGEYSKDGVRINRAEGEFSV